jgi:molecular chaperone Hsp33
VPLEGEPLVDAAHTYFRQSEQLPTFIRLAVARHYGPATGEGQRVWAWRAGGLMVQQLPREGGKRPDAAASEDDDEENWNRARHLAATVEDHELLDPTLAPERLLYRLFHEEGVRVTPTTALAAECRCSRARIHGYLQRFGAEELKDMREADGGITVTCEFCSRKYRFSSADIG